MEVSTVKNTNSAAESGSFVRKTRGYSVVQNEALFNDNLSMSAKGLYALIAARIDYTAVPLTKQWLMNHCTEGERAFNRAWDMLKNNGYLVAHIHPAKHGRFCYEYELRDSNNGWNGVYKQQTAPEPPCWQPKEQPMPVRRRARYRGKLNYKCRKITGFMACYYRYCALLRKAYKGKVSNRCYYLLRDDFLRYNRYRRQCDLLWESQITTLDELLTCKGNLQAEYNALTAQRKVFYRGKNKTTPADYSGQIQALTARIRELRREIGTCADIEMDCEMVQDKVQRAKQAEKAELRVAENTHYNHVCAYGSHH